MNGQVHMPTITMTHFREGWNINRINKMNKLKSSFSGSSDPNLDTAIKGNHRSVTDSFSYANYYILISLLLDNVKSSLPFLCYEVPSRVPVPAILVGWLDQSYSVSHYWDYNIR